MMRATVPELHPAPGWPPDDTEESVAGSNRHQTAILNARWGINRIAHVLAGPGELLPFQALSQTMILGFTRRDGTRYTTLPDVFVYRTPIALDRPSVSLITDGPPVLVIEVVSESTRDADLDLDCGKGWAYALGGVREYLVLDPTGLYVPEPVRAWRLEGGAYRPWHADADGRWHSTDLPLAIAVEDGTAAVYSSEGLRQPREGELGATLARKNAELDRLRRRIDELEQEQP